MRELFLVSEDKDKDKDQNSITDQLHETNVVVIQPQSLAGLK